jgi:hypothetical protein
LIQASTQNALERRYLVVQRFGRVIRPNKSRELKSALAENAVNTCGAKTLIFYANQFAFNLFCAAGA